MQRFRAGELHLVAATAREHDLRWPHEMLGSAGQPLSILSW
jgi:hypothetical protein